MEKEFVSNLPPVRVQVDLNSRGRDGLVRARLSRVNGVVAVGSRVTVFEPEDRVAAHGCVRRIDLNSGFVYLDVDWSTLDDDRYVAHTPTVMARLKEASNAIGDSMQSAAASGTRVVSQTLSLEYKEAAQPENKATSTRVVKDLALR